MSIIPAILLSLTIMVPAYAENVFWRYAVDRYERSVLMDKLEVPSGLNPYEFLAGELGYDAWITRDEKSVVILSEQASSGEVPILCLHKIGDDDNYALTPQRFRELLQYINANGWYMVTDSQYLKKDFSRVPTGLKPIVMGSDDASYGTLIYQTVGDSLTGRVRRFFGKPIMERDSMAAILERYAKKEDNRINFTFYVSFDAVPFRQLDGYKNPGFPYRNIPVVAEKIRYLDNNFILGIHALSHIYAYEMGIHEFAEDVLAAWNVLDEYAGAEALTVQTLAFPFGIENLSAELESLISSLSRNGRRLVGGFDLDNAPAAPPGSLKKPFEVSRINVDNSRWQETLNTLNSINAVSARREIIWETASKRLPNERLLLGAAPSDGVWVLVKDD
ncbi:MAG: hypothetical protein B0D92_04025 [Spirochaeta sp. LUC14_002_19_P3]|nr:MAG: hypothetical protein B0D92_04025 [Spirochaeta sp. LUC14_002_19_P3]